MIKKENTTDKMAKWNLLRQLEGMPDIFKSDKDPPLILSESIQQEIIGNSVLRIRNSLFSLDKDLSILDITEDERYELINLTDTEGDSGAKVTSLETKANTYRQKAFNETNPRKKGYTESVKKLLSWKQI